MKTSQMMRFLFMLMMVWSTRSSAQTGEPAVSVPSVAKKFVPKGYEALDFKKGDLNRDSYPDAILVLHKANEKETSDVIDHPEKRPLLILLGQPDQSYKLATRSNNAVYCIDCGGQMGDPFTGITIKNGNFSVEHYGGSSWRWTRIVTFKYDLKSHKWFLYKDGGDSFHASDPEKVKTTVKTAKSFGKVSFEKFDIYLEN